MFFICFKLYHFLMCHFWCFILSKNLIAFFFLFLFFFRMLSIAIFCIFFFLFVFFFRKISIVISSIFLPFFSFLIIFVYFFFYTEFTYSGNICYRKLKKKHFFIFYFLSNIELIHIKIRLKVIMLEDSIYYLLLKTDLTSLIT